MPIAEISSAIWRAGLYGKLPSQGDFVTRHLQKDFVAPWDAWLQAGMVESRARLEDRWEQAYQEAPVWRFVIAPGGCGAAAWAGIFQPSVDRVGRYFPFAVAARILDAVDPFETILQCGGWHDSIETVASAAFDADTSVEEIDQRLEGVVFPEVCIAQSKIASEDTLPIVGWQLGALSIPIVAGDTRDTLRIAFQRKVTTPESGLCAWMTRGSQAVGPVILVGKAMPSPRQFCALIDGGWDEHGWERLVRTDPPVPRAEADLSVDLSDQTIPIGKMQGAKT